MDKKPLIVAGGYPQRTLVTAALIAAAASPTIGLWGSRAPWPRPEKVPDPEREAKAQAKRDRKAAKKVEDKPVQRAKLVGRHWTTQGEEP